MVLSWIGKECAIDLQLALSAAEEERDRLKVIEKAQAEYLLAEGERAAKSEERLRRAEELLDTWLNKAAVYKKGDLIVESTKAFLAEKEG